MLLFLSVLLFQSKLFAAEMKGCVHYWLQGNTRIPTGINVGIDVGQSPHGKTGVYVCTVELKKVDTTKDHYLYLGEVGDAAYLKVEQVNQKPTSLRLPITHGLDPEDKHAPTYLRYLPFVVSLRDLYIEDGLHQFALYYQDIVPLQAGIRSGPPSVEPLFGTVKRFLKSSPALTYHFFQILYFLLATLGFLFWPKIPGSRRLLLACTSFCAALVIIQVTAIPRSFFSPQIALRLTVLCQFLAYPFLFLSISQFFSSPFLSLKNAIRLHIAATSVTILCLAIPEPQGKIYFLWFGVLAFLLGGSLLLTLGFLIHRKKLLPLFTFRIPTYAAFLFMGLGLIFVFDAFNLIILKGRFYYLNHFFFFLIPIILLRHFQSLEGPNNAEFHTTLEKIKTDALNKIVDLESTDLLNHLAENLARLLGCKHCHVFECADGATRSLGGYGEWQLISAEQPIPPSSIQIKPDQLIIPFFQNGSMTSFIIFSSFPCGSVAPFFLQRLQSIQNECGLVINLIVTQRHNFAQNKLLKMQRSRTHWLQLESEEYFLRHFNLSSRTFEYSFILGDVVDSTFLNERYGGEKIEKTVDDQLRLIWEKFRNLGILINRSKGDAVSILIPNQSKDVDSNDAFSRGINILRFLSHCEHEFTQLSRKNGIALPLRYRFAMAKAKNAGIKSMHLMVDASIDSAARALSSIALAGECLVVEHAGKTPFPFDSSFMKLEGHRVKGKVEALQVYALRAS